MARRKSGGAKPAESTKPTLVSALTSPWDFLRPTDELHTLIANSTKEILDPLATSIVDEQTLRRQINKKRKRSETDSIHPQLQLKNLYTEGFTSNQIWEQAIRILESAGAEVERDVTLLAKDIDYPSSTDEDSDVSGPEGLESESDEVDGMSDELDEGEISDELDEDMDEDMEDSNMLEEEELDGELEEDMSEDEEGSTSSGEEEDPGVYTEDKFGLNDGFFSIDDFNKQSEFLERQDARGDVEEEDSDDEVDWHANPMVPGSSMATVKNSSSKEPSRSKKDEDEDEDEDEDMDDSEEEGPTFGNVDLNADTDEDEDASENEDAEATGWLDTSEIKYADFFAPPPRKASSKRARALPKTQPAITEEDVNRAMADARRDLFDEESDIEDEAGAEEAAGPQSTHEKQRARIADEIRRLEAANVAKKQWMVSGEARAVERPVNSLIEEDLDFERVGKPVPVVTNETSEDIEELIKRRILAQEFDEVIRRRPGAGDGKTPRSARFELDDTKPQQSLAEMYEADHLRASDPNYVDSKDRKLAKEHDEVNSLWTQISAQLDTLCNWHYKPKVAQASINVVTDAPTITMEDARPSAGSAAGGPSALAPQEIYAPGDDGKVAGELVLKTGATISKDEMSREEKARARRHKKSQKDDADKPKKSAKAIEKQQLVSDLKQGGVKVVNKEGQITQIDGSRVREPHKNRGDNLKL
ncbi:hypothetical protein N7495_000658 [Penicillium taxi]|uniref:uncharacterized protein n=1 Tax=Penicillium taxi TaxID=168475 RepID=UPI002544D857|nr:uncharacterized protein N7495_000658 [Penicillium taxi]KAJ5907976.1 hypothetical protein N7495_000658 [Penicillium taxi]